MIHDSDYCKCEMCVAADSYEKREAEKVCDDIDAVLMGLSPFAAAWASAPETQRRYTERDCAAYWFEQGQIAGMGTIKQDLAEMRQLMREKGLA